MRVLITGGTGFVGYWLQQTQPNHIRGTYLNSATYNQLNWKRLSFDAIIHAAPVSPVHVLEYAQYYNIRVLYISSGIVYHPESNNIEYRQLKLDGEKDCLDSGTNIVLARLFTFYGEKLDNGKAYTQFVNAATNDETLYVWGDGSTVRSYMHGRDVALRLWALLELGERGKAYDVGSNDAITTLELATEIIEMYNSNSKIEFVNEYVPMPHYLPENTEPTELCYSEWAKRLVSFQKV